MYLNNVHWILMYCQCLHRCIIAVGIVYIDVWGVLVRAEVRLEIMCVVMYQTSSDFPVPLENMNSHVSGT